MFSENEQISKRQLNRLVFIDFLGGSSLLVPTYLAGVVGVWGALCIVVGGMLGILFQYSLLHLVERHRRLSIPPKALGLLYLLLGLLSVGFFLYVAHLLSSLMNTYLSDISYWVFLFCTIVVSVYTLRAGIEGRARAYEILFWIILIPLFVMLFLASFDVDTIYLLPQRPVSISSIGKGIGYVFLFYLPMLFLLFQTNYINCPIKEWRKTACRSLLLSTLLLLVIYLILLGCFGRGSMIRMNYPIVTLMSTVDIAGFFFQRLDALMLFVWFFSLFSMLSLSLRFTVEFLKKAKSLLAILLVMVLFTGCGNVELEQRSFPMLMAVEKYEDDTVGFYYEFAKANMGQFGVGESFEESRSNFEMTVPRKIDVNHLKVFVIGTSLLEDRQKMDNMLKSITTEEIYPRNVYVCTSSTIEKMMDLSIDDELGEYVKSYLKEHLDKQTTLKDLLNAYDNQVGAVEIPRLEVEHKLIVLKDFEQISWENE